MGRGLLGYDPWNDYLIRGTGNATLDNAEFAKAVTVMNARARGAIVVDRTVTINAFHNLTAPVGLRGRDNGAVLKTSGATAWVAWGGFTYPWTSGSAVAFNSVLAGSSTIVSPNLALAENDYVAIWSDDVVTSITAHNPETSYISAEILRISQAVTGSANTWRFADVIDDPMSTNPKILKLSMLKGVRVSDLRMEHAPGTGSIGTNLRFGYCADLKIENVTFGYPHQGQLGIIMCHGTQISGLRIEDCEDYNAGGLGTPAPVKYGIVVGPSSDTQIEHCLIQNVRHPLTTGGIDYYRPWAASEAVAVGAYRWNTTLGRAYRCTVGGTTSAVIPDHLTLTAETSGTGGAYDVTWLGLGTSIDNKGVYRMGTIKNLTFRNNICKNNAFQPSGGSGYSGMTCVDTHSEGRHIVIEGNKVIVSGEAQNTGISIRSRDTIVRNNVIDMPTNSAAGVGCIGIAIIGANCVVENNLVEGGFYNEVSVPSYTSPSNVDNVIWRNNTFKNMFGPAIRIMSGTGHCIINNTFENCAYSYASNQEIKSVIWIGGLTTTSSTVDIIDNSIPKRSNDMPIAWADTVLAAQVKAYGNRLDGYGTNSIGMFSQYWRASETCTTGDVRRYLNNEYRWTNATGSVGGTAPTHTSGTTSGWRFSRAITSSKLAEWEATFGQYNRDVKFSVVLAAAHTMTTANKNWIINNVYAPFDDTSTSHVTDRRVLIDVIDQDYLVVAEPGHIIEMPTSMIAQVYTIAGNGRNLWWDLSASGYKAAKPGDSYVTSPVVLHVLSYTSNFLQVKLPTDTGCRQLTVNVGDETTDLTTGTAKVTFRMPVSVSTLTGIKASVNTAPVGSTIVVDVNVGGSTILTPKLSIDASEKTSTTAASAVGLLTNAIAEDAEVTIDIDQVGSSTAGKGLKVTFLW